MRRLFFYHAEQIEKIGKICYNSGERVLDLKNVDSGVNYALSKSKFAEFILAKEYPFDKVNFENFIPIFQIIKKIITEENYLDRY